MVSESNQECCSFEDLLRGMDFEFFGSGNHKISTDKLLSQSDAVLLDIRSIEEVQTLTLQSLHDLTVLHIPTNEIPDRLKEIPKNRPIGIFCSSGVRATMVYAYLRTIGFEQVYILIGGYSDLMEQIKPGKLYKRLKAQG